MPCPNSDELRRVAAVDSRPTVVAKAMRTNVKTARRWLTEIGIDRPATQRVPVAERGYAMIAYSPRLGERVVARLYDAWLNMRRRVFSNHPRVVKYYRDKGIKSHPAWDDYAVFRAWGLATGFCRGMTLDRIDTNGNYEPDNCRWIPQSRQQDNSSRVHWLTLNGVTKSLPVWARELGFKTSTLRTRITSGWTTEQILKTPHGQLRPDVQHKPRGRRPKSAVLLSPSSSTAPNQGLADTAAHREHRQ